MRIEARQWFGRLRRRDAEGGSRKAVYIRQHDSLCETLDVCFSRLGEWGETGGLRKTTAICSALVFFFLGDLQVGPSFRANLPPLEAQRWFPRENRGALFLDGFRLKPRIIPVRRRTATSFAVLTGRSVELTSHWVGMQSTWERCLPASRSRLRRPTFTAPKPPRKQATVAGVGKCPPFGVIGRPR